MGRGRGTGERLLSHARLGQVVGVRWLAGEGRPRVFGTLDVVAGRDQRLVEVLVGTAGRPFVAGFAAGILRPDRRLDRGR